MSPHRRRESRKLHGHDPDHPLARPDGWVVAARWVLHHRWTAEGVTVPRCEVVGCGPKGRGRRAAPPDPSPRGVTVPGDVANTLCGMVDPRAYRSGARMALGALGRGCYFPGCATATFSWADNEPYFNLEIAHICAAEEGGPRWHSGMTDNERRAFWNVILLCPGHHTAVDQDGVRFSVKLLYEWKTQREGSHAGVLASFTDAEITDIVETKAAELVREVRDAIELVRDVSAEAADLLTEVFRDGHALVESLDTWALDRFAAAADGFSTDALERFAAAADGFDTDALERFAAAADGFDFDALRHLPDR